MISKEVEAISNGAPIPGSELNKKKIYVCCPIRPKAKDPEVEEESGQSGMGMQKHHFIRQYSAVLTIVLHIRLKSR